MNLWRYRTLAILFSTSFSCSLHADEIILKNQAKPIVGTIKSETGLGVELEGQKAIIPAGDIDDIEYRVLSESYGKARAKEKELQAKTGTGRQDLLLETRALYSASLREIHPDQIYVRRHIEFRIALIRSRISIEFNKSTELAMQNLVDFKTKYKDAWQTGQCLQMLAALQLAHGENADAEKTFTELAQAAVPNEVKLDAELQAARIQLRTGKVDQALAKLEALSKKVPKNSQLALHVVGARAECLAAGKKTAEARTLLQQLIKEAPDKNVKAMAHNTLGTIFFDQGQLKEASWEFLWVDVLYNQDKAEHAKALYYLGQIFEKLGQPERARECRNQLLNDRQFAGLEFQMRAQAETKR